jgi:cytoskeletal protein RodZ
MTSRLKEARQKAGYTIEEVAEILKIRRQYIADLEEENFRNIPGQVYVDGYMKIYCEFLGIDFHQKGDKTVAKPVPVVEESSVNKKYIALFAACMLVILVSIYSLLKIPSEQVVLEEEVEEGLIQGATIINEDRINHHGSNEKTID